MEFRIADTFTDSLAKLTGDEQKAVKTAAFDLQLNPAQPGLQFHKLDKPKDPNFWSVRVNRDVRLIVHRSDASLLLCYVSHMVHGIEHWVKFAHDCCDYHVSVITGLFVFKDDGNCPHHFGQDSWGCKVGQQLESVAECNLLRILDK